MIFSDRWSLPQSVVMLLRRGNRTKLTIYDLKRQALKEAL